MTPRFLPCSVLLLALGCAHNAQPATNAPAQTSAQDAGSPDAAAPVTNAEWVPAPVTRRLPGGQEEAQTLFQASDETKSGTFRAMFESALDKRDKVTGTFKVARFRYVYALPIGDGEVAPIHDEEIHTVLLDCEQGFSGTLSTTYKLAGNAVGSTDAKESDLLMVQSSLPSTITDLCEFLRLQER